MADKLVEIYSSEQKVVIFQFFERDFSAVLKLARDLMGTQCSNFCTLVTDIYHRIKPQSVPTANLLNCFLRCVKVLAIMCVFITK